MPPVRKALQAASDQLNRYAPTLLKSQGTELRLRSYSVVALGFERVVGEQVGQPNLPASPPS